MVASREMDDSMGVLCFPFRHAGTNIFVVLLLAGYLFLGNECPVVA